MLANLCAIVIEGYEWWNIFRYIALAVMVLCALFVIIVVLMQQGQNSMYTAPHAMIFPAIYFALLMIAFNLFGNGLRDAFNPSTRGEEG